MWSVLCSTDLQTSLLPGRYCYYTTTTTITHISHLTGSLPPPHPSTLTQAVSSPMTVSLTNIPSVYMTVRPANSANLPGINDKVRAHHCITNCITRLFLGRLSCLAAVFVWLRNVLRIKLINVPPVYYNTITAPAPVHTPHRESPHSLLTLDNNKQS